MQQSINFIITNKDLHYACTKNKFLKLLWNDGTKSAVNCKVGLFKKFDRFVYDEIDTQIRAIEPCDFHEYISMKAPFIFAPKKL